MDELWTLSELVGEASACIGALPPQTNGQVRPVPDERTIRYYGTLGLLDKPELRGRTAFYRRKHLAQVIAIKRLQSAGHSLADIQSLWPTLDDIGLARMSGVELPAIRTAKASRSEFWKKEPIVMTTQAQRSQSVAAATEPARPYDAGPPVMGVISLAQAPRDAVAHPPVELRIELAPNVCLSLAVADGVAISAADIRALRAAAAPLIELAQRAVAAHPGGDDR